MRTHDQGRDPANPARNRWRVVLSLSFSALLLVLSGLVGGSATAYAAAKPSAVGMFSSKAKPKTKAVGSKKSVNLGVRFSTSVDGTVDALQFYRSKNQKRAYVASLWGPDGALLARATFKKSSKTGWQTVSLPKPVKLKKGKTYTASYLASGGRFASTRGYYAKKRTNNGITVAKKGGVFSYSKKSKRPTTKTTASYLIDVMFTPSKSVALSPSKPDPTPPPATPTPQPSTPTSAPAARPDGFPNASTTGVRAGVNLKESGSIVVTRDGTVIEGLHIRGEITVRADNVVIRDTLIQSDTTSYPILVASGSTGTLIEHVEVDNLQSTGINIYFQGGSGTVRNANIHSGEDGIRIEADGVVVENSYIHHLELFPGGHHDTIQIRSGDNVIIRGNNLQAYNPDAPSSLQENAAIQIGSLVSGSDPISNFLVENNLMNGGAYAVNGGRAADLDSAIYRNNRFGRDALYGAGGNFSRASTTWATSNVWDDNGRAAGAHFR